MASKGCITIFEILVHFGNGNKGPLYILECPKSFIKNLLLLNNITENTLELDCALWILQNGADPILIIEINERINTVH